MGQNIVTTELAAALAKHYVRKGNKILFSNGMTLNDLATEMYARSKSGEIDPSVLSRSINGKRLLTVQQLDVLSDILALTSIERNGLRLALSRDIHRRHNLRIDPTEPIYVEIFEKDLALIQQLIIRGDPQLGVEIAETTFRRLSTLVESATSSHERNLFLQLSAMILFEKGRASREMLPMNEVVLVTKPIAKEMRNIAKECADEQFSGLASLSLGDAYYIAANYRQSISYLRSGYAKVWNLEHRLWALRQLLLDWAYLKDETNFKAVTSQAKELLKSDHLRESDLVCAVQEGIARGEGQLGWQVAYDSLEIAKASYRRLVDNKVIAPFRQIQIVRTELELIRQFDPKRAWILEKDALVAIRSASERGYIRHATYMQELLSELLQA